MVRKNFTPEQIINKLREADIHINQGIPITEAVLFRQPVKEK